MSKLAYHIPADGKLKEKQVRDYIEIRKNILERIKVRQSGANAPKAATMETNSAKENYPYYDEIERVAALNFDMSYDEYLWIKDTVITTQTHILLKQYYDLNNRIMELLDDTLARYREVDIPNLDGQEKKIMDGYVDEMKQEIMMLGKKIPVTNVKTDSLQNNIQIISKYKSELEVLDKQSLLSSTP